MTKTTLAITAAFALLMFCILTGCSKSSDAGPPGPAVGSATPQGGKITVAPQHGNRPHMGMAPK